MTFGGGSVDVAEARVFNGYLGYHQGAHMFPLRCEWRFRQYKRTASWLFPPTDLARRPPSFRWQTAYPAVSESL
jgi:hypothetical protein